MAMELAAVFVAGVLNSAHCIGMCGGFAATVGANQRSLGSNLSRQLIYSAGRIFTYAFLGAISGFAGKQLSNFDTPVVNVQQVFSIIAGLMMVVVGLSVLGLFRFRWAGANRLAILFATGFRQLLHAPGRTGFFVAGLANGFLPCGLVYAFLAAALATGGVFEGSLLMAVFGLGTVPAMLAVGCGAMLLGHTARQRVFQLAAVMIVVTGVITIKRGWPTDDGKACCDDVTPIVAADLHLSEPPAKLP